MFKRSANSELMRTHALRAGLFALALAMPGAAMADPAEPLVMDPTYSERIAVTPVAGCAVTIAALTDNRRAPETIGIVPAIRSISAPADRQAWFRSIVETGLRERGFTPTIVLAPEPAPMPAAAAAPEVSAEAIVADAAATSTDAIAPAPLATPAPGPEVLTVRVGLQSVWLTALGMNKSGSVVLHMSAAHGAQSKDGYYRGEYVSPNWANGRGEFNEHLDRTFAEALNAMAADLAPMCGGAT